MRETIAVCLAFFGELTPSFSIVFTLKIEEFSTLDFFLYLIYTFFHVFIF